MISMYEASVPPMIRSLSNLRAILETATAYAQTKNIDPTVLFNARLYPDMYPLVKQVQIATDVAKGAVSRLAGIEPPKFEDNESTFAELISRIDKTLNLLHASTAAQIDGSEENPIVFLIRDKTVTFQGLPYLRDFVLPNVYFHVTTVYAILRHNGVEIGKRDFLGNVY
ncbi:MAG: hypothetical protein RLZZ66_699 [Pseudomonadota bacterium]|jgi:hypothetical protein